MTYGWAILIIAVVLGALFALGIFNSANLAPKLPPGSCQVFRPNGPGSTSYINTEGTCNNELPQYVAQFNGQTASVTVPVQNFNTNTNSYTFTAWINSGSLYPGGTGIVVSYYPYIGISVSVGDIRCWQNSYSNGLNTINTNVWVFVACDYAGMGSVSRTVYINGIAGLTDTSGSVGSYTGASDIGYFYYSCYSTSFKGMIANVQIYNISLSANEITALYDEGIGGVPLNLNNLVGWWPLNGNGNDYSGNLNNGVPTNVVYTSSWASSYSAP